MPFAVAATRHEENMKWTYPVTDQCMFEAWIIPLTHWKPEGRVSSLVTLLNSNNPQPTFSRALSTPELPSLFPETHN